MPYKYYEYLFVNTSVIDLECDKIANMKYITTIKEKWRQQID